MIFVCARCRCLVGDHEGEEPGPEAPLGDSGEITTPSGAPSGVSMPSVIVPPDGWIGHPDQDGVICGNCATPEEIAEWMGDLALIDAVDPLGTHGGDGENTGRQ